MNKKLLIIPARIGSKRIKNKNIKKFKGKPIIKYSIETALKSKLFDEIHVSTDSLKVIKLIEKYPINIDFLRPKRLSGNETTLIEVYKFIVKKLMKLEKNFNEIWYLFPCSPLIEKSDLISASKFVKKNKIKNLLAVAEYPHPIQRAFKLGKMNKLTPNNKNTLKVMTQGFEKRYHDTGTFGMINFDNLMNSKILKFTGYIMPKRKAIDIDTIEDWEIAENLFKK